MLGVLPDAAAEGGVDVRMGSDEPKLHVSSSAIASVVAALSDDKTVSDAERGYHEAEERAVIKPGGHVEMPDESGRKRLYSVTTIAAAAKYGGTRTVMICDSFERARDALTKNAMYWWEHSYAFAVIESFYLNAAYGGFGFQRQQYWYVFAWDRSAPPGEYPDARYEAIEKPAFFEYHGEFAVG